MGLLFARVAREWPMVEERAAGEQSLGRKSGLSPCSSWLARSRVVAAAMLKLRRR
jgi:hypothetical protein